MPAQAPRVRAVPRSRSNPATVPRISKVVTPVKAGRSRPASQPGGMRLGGGGRGAVRSVYGPGNEAPSRKLKEFSPATPALAAEYLACLVIIAVNTLSQPKDYSARMTQVLWRSTAVTAVFFVLALASMNAKISKITVAFGGLIVAGVLYNATSSVKNTLDALAGKGTGTSASDDATFLASTEPPHTIQPVPDTS